MLIAEDLLLLLTDDESGKVDAGWWGTLEMPLGGAVLMELALAGKVDVAGPGEEVKEGRLVVRDATPTGSTVLDQGLAVVADRVGKKPESAIEALGKGVAGAVREGLGARGILREEKSKVLGLFPRTTWPAADVAHEAQVRQAIAATLVHGASYDARTGSLIALLSASELVTSAVDAKKLGVSKGDLRKAAKAVSDQGFAPEAVRKAVEAMQAALVIMVATTVTTTAVINT